MSCIEFDQAAPVQDGVLAMSNLHPGKSQDTDIADISGGHQPYLEFFCRSNHVTLSESVQSDTLFKVLAEANS